MSESGREPSHASGSGPDALQDVPEWPRRPPGCPGVVGSPSRKSGSGREALPDVWVAFPVV